MEDQEPYDCEMLGATRMPESSAEEMAEERERFLRVRCLELAHRPMADAKGTVEQAEVYLKFVKGEGDETA